MATTRRSHAALAAARAVEADPRWAQLVARDASADGAFYYSVVTTGVYCNPSCRSRRPRPENVAFHDTPAAAERAGFRACKRCKPARGPGMDPNAERVVRLCRIIETRDEPPTLAELAAEVGLSRFHTQRVFKAATGLSPRAYAAAVRAGRVREGLASGARVTEAMYDAGFQSSGRFYERTAEMLGMTPSAYRAGGAAARIRFAVGECSLGAILVAATERGICAVTLGDEPEALVHQLERRFPKATLVGADAAFEAWMAQIVGAVEAPRLGVDLPLDVRGTAFSRRVWEALRRIPVGETRSYREIAEAIGAPRAARAVAQVCARNPVAIAIPCHRVVRQNGELGGYRWGVARKRRLLDSEGAPSGGRET